MLDDLPQLDVAALASVWPHGKFRARKDASGSDIAETQEALAHPVESLTAASMRAVIERTVQGDLSDLQLLAEAEQVPGFTKSLRTYVRWHLFCIYRPVLIDWTFDAWKDRTMVFLICDQRPAHWDRGLVFG